jgi:hypothetical protein
MYSAKSKIKFYSLGSEKIDLSKMKEILDSSKPVIASKGFNRALKSVIDKDINLLANNLKKIAEAITKLLLENGIINEAISTDIEKIDDVVNDVETVISKVIIEKESIKIGLFSTKKKEKKQRYKKLDTCMNKLSKYQSELISIKDEYNKLAQRKSVLKDEDLNEEEETISEDPLERTINFYMNIRNKN